MMSAASTEATTTAGPASLMAAPDPSSSPVPMDPPMATIAIWAAESSFLSPPSLLLLGCVIRKKAASQVLSLIAAARVLRIQYASLTVRSTFDSPPLCDGPCLPGPASPEAARAVIAGPHMADISKRLEKADKYLQKGKQKDALSEYLAILDEDPNQDAVRQSAADLCAALGEPNEAAKLFSVLFDHQAQSGNGAGALVTYKKLIRVGQPTVDQIFKHAQFADKKGEKKEAIEGFHTAAKTFASAGRKRDAALSYKALAVLEPDLENWKQLAVLSAESSDPKTAAQAYYQAALLEKAAGNNPLPT